MPSIPRTRAAAFCCVLLSLIGAASASAATTFVPNRLDDPLVGGSTCAPPAPANACSLRGAVAAAQNGDAISLGAAVYTLSQGQLDLTKQITIGGAGAHATTIRQTAQDRVFRVLAPAGLTMHDLTVTGGHYVGADGPNGPTVGTAGGPGQGGYGAGIDASGAVTLTDVAVTGNTATGGKGGDGHSGSANGGAGGDGGFADGAGISGGNPLTLTRVAVTGNIAHAGTGGKGGPAGTAGTGGAGGKAGSANGGGIGLGNATFVARDTLIAGNQALPGDGGAGGTGGTTSGAGGVGGQGEPADGGGLFSNGVVKLTNVTFSGNLVSGSTGGKGGAAKSLGVQTAGGAGGPSAGGAGGAVALMNGSTGQFASVTIASNSTTSAVGGAGGAGSGGGLAGAAGQAGPAEGGNLFVYSSTLTMRDTIVASGSGLAGSENCSVRGGATLTSAGHNLEDRNQCIATLAAGDHKDATAGLGPLQDNGGPTSTMALLPGSAAIGAGASPCVDVAGQPLTTDQRGRPRGAPCDIGAFEGQAPSVTTAPAIAGAPVATHAVTCAGGAFGGDLPQTSAVQWLRTGAPIAGATAASYTVALADVGLALSCRQTVTNAFGAVSATSAAVTGLPLPPVVVPKVPKLSGLKLSPKKVRNGHKVRITFTLSGAGARIRFSLHHASPHRLKKASGAPKSVSIPVGAARVTWKPHGLKPGRYELTATPFGGPAVKVAFTVRR